MSLIAISITAFVIILVAIYTPKSSEDDKEEKNSRENKRS
jgi:hypothetical protein